jgi:hypothetical protein
MRLNNVRAILAAAVVGTFMGITGFMAIYPLLSRTPVNLDAYSSFFAKTASVYTGIVGVIVGYYFGRAEESERPERKTQDPSRPENS